MPSQSELSPSVISNLGLFVRSGASFDQCDDEDDDAEQLAGGVVGVKLC
jgi:hypothetical protein